MVKVTQKPIISADSHVTEPPELYHNIEKKYADAAPRLVQQPNGGDAYVIDGIQDPFPIMLSSAAGYSREQLGDRAKQTFDKSFAGGWDPKQRLLDQDRDGIAGEVLYPSLGMFLCNHPDTDFKAACFNVYNEWLAEYSATAPDRLIGLGQTVLASPKEGICDLEKMKALGLRGVMLPGFPVMEDYHSKIYDPFWEAAVDLEMPVSFHILTYKNRIGEARGPRINSFMSIMRGNQDVIGVMVFGGVFDRNPKLQMVCVEADGGWVPHYMYRMDHVFNRCPEHWQAEVPLERMPSEYMRENVYVTFQDDQVAFQVIDLVNSKRMMWANDFPHLDSTWPNSQKLLSEQTGGLTPQQRDDLLHNNVAELYRL